MPSTPIANLPAITTPTLDDLVIIEQVVGTTVTTHKGTLRQLLGIAAPVPTITNLSWNEADDELTIDGANILPITLVFVNDLPYLIQTHENVTATTATIKIEIEDSLPTGTHTVKLQNFIHEATNSFTI